MVSAVILAYNRCAEVLKTIQKLKEYSAYLLFNLDIIVVDNASVDDTSKKVREKYPEVILITKPKNNGIAGWNEGFKVVKNKYFLVLDDDSHIEDGLPEAINYLEANAAIGILALNIFGGVYQTDDETEWKDKEDCAGFIGCGAIIRKALYDKIGGFAEWLYVYTHEYEYGLRCMNAGYKIRFFKNSRIVHRTSNLNRTNKRLRTFSVRNELAIIYKYFPKNRWKYLLRVFINNLKLVKSEGFSAGSYVIEGTRKFIKMRNKIIYTPVSPEIQKFFITKFRSAQPVFSKIIKRFRLS